MLSEIAAARLMLRDGAARTLRESAGLTAADIARHLGVDTSTVLRWEAGQRRPRGEMAERYAAVLTEIVGVVDGGR